MSEYRLQPDGRMVAGPELTAAAASRRVSGIAAAVAALAVIAGFAAGRATAPGFHEIAASRVAEGCVPYFRAVSTDDAGRADLEADAAEAPALLRAEGASRVEVSFHGATDGVRRLDPTATSYGVVSWEECA